MTGVDVGAVSEAVVALDGVRYAYPGRRRSAERSAAVDGLSLVAERGEMLGLVGPNGSGKSTAFRLMTGRAAATSGTVRVLGVDPSAAGGAMWDRVGVMFQSPAVDPELTVGENLRVHAALFGLGGAWRKRAEALLDEQGLGERRGERVGRLSGGQRRRVELVKALLAEPELLLLDEPTAGLDPEAVRGLWDALDALRAERGLTIVVSTHVGDDAMRCDRVVLMDAGRALATGRPGELVDRSGGDVIRVEVREDGESAEAMSAGGLAWVSDGPTVGGYAWLAREIDAAASVPRIAAALGDRLLRVSVSPPGLADVFSSLRRSAETDQPDGAGAVAAGAGESAATGR
ncbi:MAG: ABC transporter ATP-binding protein [Planctomycetota bacterium]